MVRERSAKPLCVGSIPTRASNLLRHLAVAIEFVVTFWFALHVSVLRKSFQIVLQLGPNLAGLQLTLPLPVISCAVCARFIVSAYFTIAARLSSAVGRT